MTRRRNVRSAIPCKDFFGFFFFPIDIRQSGEIFRKRISIRVFEEYSTDRHPFLIAISKDLSIVFFFFFFPSIFARAEGFFKREKKKKKLDWRKSGGSEVGGT